MQSLADKSFSIGQWDLVNENCAIFWDRKYVSSTWTYMDFRNLFEMDVNTLLDDVIEGAIEDLQCPTFSACDDCWDVPLGIKPLELVYSEPHCIDFLCQFFFQAILPHNIFAWLLSSGKKRFSCSFVQARSIFGVSLWPFSARPFLALRSYFVLPFDDESICSDWIESSIVSFPSQLSDNAWVIAETSKFFKCIAVVNID